MGTQRRFADAASLAGVVREVFGTDRRIVSAARLPNGSKKGVYRVALDDRSSAIVYVWSAEEDYWDGRLPDDAGDPAGPFVHSCGLDLFEAATRRLATVGARSPRLLFADRSRRLYPADIAVVEDIPGETLESLLERDPRAGRSTLEQLARTVRAMHRYRAPAHGNVAAVDGGRAAAATCQQSHLEGALGDIAEAAARDERAARERGLLEDKLHELYAQVEPRSRFGLVHGELGPDHVLVGRDGEPVLIDIEGLAYSDVEVEHCWMRMRFGEDYGPLRAPDLDPKRLRFYQYTMHLGLVGGPLRIADGDFPNREWMLGVADHHLALALAYEVRPAGSAF
jgi:hypothetical protein